MIQIIFLCTQEIHQMRSTFIQQELKKICVLKMITVGTGGVGTRV